MEMEVAGVEAEVEVAEVEAEVEAEEVAAGRDVTVRNMNASTAQRWTAGPSLASRRPSVAESSLPDGLMLTRCAWWTRHTFASATHARQRT